MLISAAEPNNFYFAVPQSHDVSHCLGTWLVWIMAANADENEILFDPHTRALQKTHGRPRSIWLKNITYDLSMGQLERRNAAQHRCSGRLLASYALRVVCADIGLD